MTTIASARRVEAAENFPVALRVLPRGVRHHLHAVYAVARAIDDIGDQSHGDRTAQLVAFRSDLRQVWRAGRPQHPVLVQLVPTVRDCRLPLEPFERLIEANLVDQQVSRYASWENLLGYCRLSADPVGRLVLAVFDQFSPQAAVLSDRVCSALQLLEHWQDVAEDRRCGRIYLPQNDMAAFAVTEQDLDAPVAGVALRTLMRFEVDRAIELLESGAPITAYLHGWARVAVAGYISGGRAAGAALRRTGGDVLARYAQPRRRDVAWSMARVLASRGHRSPALQQSVTP